MMIVFAVGLTELVAQHTVSPAALSVERGAVDVKVVVLRLNSDVVARSDISRVV